MWLGDSKSAYLLTVMPPPRSFPTYRSRESVPRQVVARPYRPRTSHFAYLVLTMVLLLGLRLLKLCGLSLDN